jgi:hypothetical protein
LFAAKDQSLLRWWDALLLFDAFLDLADLVVRLDVEFDLFAGEGTDPKLVISTRVARLSRSSEKVVEGVGGALLDKHFDEYARELALDDLKTRI